MNSTILEEPHVSFSQINTYLGCPLKYRFAYIEQLAPEFVPSALPFGGGSTKHLPSYTGVSSLTKAKIMTRCSILLETCCVCSTQV